MKTLHGSRRAFVGGAAASVALLGAVTVLRKGEPDTVAPNADGKPVPARAGVVPAAARSPEIAKWAAAVGSPVRIAGESRMSVGVVDIVLNADDRGQRPAGVRRQPFFVHFVMDRADAPQGDRIYSITSPIEGLSEVFLTRGEDRGTKAVLVALFG